MRRILIDGNHLTGRCRATLGEMTTSSGRRSGVIYGFLRGLHYLHLEHNIDYPEITVCWDKGRCAKRMEIYPEYKGNRTKENQTPEQEREFIEYMAQIKEIKVALEHVGCRQSSAQNVEADDLVGIFSRDYADAGESVFIYSGDHDMHQLVDDNIKILDPKQGVLGRTEVEAKWSCSIEQIPLVKAVMGDSSDNIEGVRGLGPARALFYVKNVGVDLSSVPAKEQKWVKLGRDNQAIIDRNLQLMTIPRTWETPLYSIDHALEAMECLVSSGYHRDETKFLEFLYAWEMNSILENLSRW